MTTGNADHAETLTEQAADKHTELSSLLYYRKAKINVSKCTRGANMRQITEQAVSSFLNGGDFKRDNTRVRQTGGLTVMLLHGNKIAYRDNTGIYLSHCDWTTNTTKERLNGILDTLNKPRIYQKDFVWYWKDGAKFKDGWNKV